MFQGHTIFQTFSFLSRFAILLAQNPIKSRHIQLILRTVSLLQTLSLILSNIHFEGSSNFLHIPTMIQMMKKLASGFTSAGIQVDTLTSNLWIKIAVYIYFLLLFGKLAIAAYQAKTCWKNPRYTNLLSILLELHAEIFFNPINYIVTELITDIYYNQDIKDFLIPNIQILGFCILLVLSLSIAIFKILFCYSPIFLNGFVSRKGSLHLVGILLIKFALTLLSGFAEKVPDKKINYQVPNGILSLTISSLVLIYTRFVLVEYDLRIMKLHTVYDAAMVTVSIIQLISLIVSDF